MVYLFGTFIVGQNRCFPMLFDNKRALTSGDDGDASASLEQLFHSTSPSQLSEAVPTA